MNRSRDVGRTTDAGSETYGVALEAERSAREASERVSRGNNSTRDNRRKSQLDST